MSAALPREQSPDVSEKQSVSPEALFFPLEASAPFAKSSDVKGQKGGHIDPFIFDIALWKILKKGKPSVDADGIKFVVRKTGSTNFPEMVKCGVIGSVNVLLLPFPEVTSQSPTNHVSFHINAPLLSSGLSPPLA